MEISIAGRHVELSTRLKEYAYERMSKLEKYYKRITKAQMILAEENSGYTCELLIDVPGHKHIVVKKEGDTFFKAVDNTLDICQRKLKEYKDKRRERKGHFHDVPEQF